jgi:hypothetical protein
MFPSPFGLWRRLSLLVFFAVTAGKNEFTSHSVPGDLNPRQTQHIIYTTSIQCLSGLAIPAKLCVFTQSHSTILPNETVVYVMAKMEVTPSMVFLNSLSLTVVPGDIGKESYQDNLPDEPFP